jgi:hypothetical protein
LAVDLGDNVPKDQSGHGAGVAGCAPIRLLRSRLNPSSVLAHAFPLQFHQHFEGVGSMRNYLQAGLVSFAAVLALPGCQRSADQAAAPAAPGAAEAPAAAATASAWPASLTVFGDGYPNPGDPCRRVGESAATVDFLDHTATLAGCLTADEAARLGGRVVATVDGVTLVSIPNDAAAAGEGEGQGDAKVAGTGYHATAQIPCSGYLGAPAGLCDAGVVRGTETGTYVEVALPDGRKRTIFFNADGSFLSFSTAQADGTAAMKIDSSREGDTTIATLGTERYEIPDAFVKGG